MASSVPLTGVILVDCAKANVASGLAKACDRCGYGDDIEAFQAALKSACDEMNVDIQEFAELPADAPIKHDLGTEAS